MYDTISMMSKKTKKFFINLLCAFVPKKAWRHGIRARLMKSSPSTPLKRSAVLGDVDIIRDDLLERIVFESEKTRFLNRMNILAAKLHSDVFLEYKNKFVDKDVVLIATGPSLTKFKPMKDAVYVGVNKAFMKSEIAFDYLFIQDYVGLDYIDGIANYPAVKFYGILPHDWFGDNGRSLLIPESIALRHKARRYMVNDIAYPRFSKYGVDEYDFAYDISTQPFSCYCSICFSAMQFILYGNPRRVFLVGCDTNHSGYFDEGCHNSLNVDTIMRGWLKMKNFCKTFYPETEIISINPVGLKGLFTDRFDKDFLLWHYSDKNYEDKFLIDNKIERMDANRADIFHPGRAAFHKDRYEFAAKYIQGKIVLDVAAGLGYGAGLLNSKGAPASVTAVELNVEAVVYAEKNYSVAGKVRFLQGSILDLPFDDNTFDVLTSFETIEHVEDEARQIREVKRVLKPGGLYILSTPNDWDNTNNPYHVRDYDYASVTRLINENFTLLEMFNQNSGCDSPYNHSQPRGMVATTEENYKNAECLIVVAKNTKIC